ncbi:hypothetical protein [Candidatus Marithrix sp. Canyon 246]|uniref:hypothetical protein n=1 Tax=Candidatus Marithrix sp. Canyon 246 TaxID=1827136 RepID=UPI00084A1A48|nr:hypothetical protein [Candidatus Marithrix sp. Canyon 246]
MFVTVGFTTAAWLIATYVTKPTDSKVLDNFYEKIQPEGYWQKQTKNKSQLGKLLAECGDLWIGWDYLCLGCASSFEE